MRILFMCVANSARSQMAEGLARNILGESHIIQSAGTKPSHVNPYAIKVMQEIGIDISNQSSESVDALNPDSVDIVITLCADEVCPVYLGKAKRLHWPLPDPATPQNSPDEQLELFRRIRDQIREKILELKQSLTQGVSA